jgi:hypothetical protein
MTKKISGSKIITGVIDWEPRNSAVGEIEVKYEAEAEAEFYAAWDYDRGRWDVDNDALTVDLLAINWIGWTAEMIAEFIEHLRDVRKRDFFEQVWETVEI